MDIQTLKKISFTFTIGLMFLSNVALADDWSFQLEPYALATTIEGDAGIGVVDSPDIEVDFDTILENLEMAGMLHFEAHHTSGWGFALDYGFMDLQGKVSSDAGGFVDASVRQGVLEGLVIKRKHYPNVFVDSFIGFRWWDNDIDVRIKSAVLPIDFERNIEEDWVDPILGMRILVHITPNSTMVLHGDVGGFGVSSDITYSMQAGIMYRMTESLTLDMRYKATWVDYEDGSSGKQGYFKYDTVTHGPLLGLSYDF
ncbi:hypothetical protein RI844_03785 [Thalassotalea fonticola]|uniref:Outer membrane protein beta-barrel domain-containing protein n=1 Tax=Thalassotalea fonticola TaxID=3065649 RepID=A0ABZ0GRE9_9GAMM|nr:hypothetical protein RI844_03785 [Colwelliaceae bacterium S1-1]